MPNDSDGTLTNVSVQKLLNEQVKRDRLMAQRSLYYLCKHILGYKDFVPHVHGKMCDFATQPQYGRFRSACVPRSWFKTWTFTIAKAIWLTLPDEESLYAGVYPYKGCNVRILIASNVIDNASKMVSKIKAEWENNERLRAAFPELVPDFNRTSWSDHRATVRRTGNYTESTYTAVGVGGAVISQHFDHILEDDLVYAKKDDFTGSELMPSQEDIDNAIGWHKLVSSLFVDPNISCIDNTGTRWAPHDLIDYIRKNEREYKFFEVAVTRDAVWPVADESECIWPERFGIKALTTIRAAQGAKLFECFPQEAPIMMADWTVKAIKDIKVGDVVIGHEKGLGKFKSTLVKATVNLCETLQKEVVKITLASGRVIRCTADHPWYTARWDNSHKPYLPARVGATLNGIYKVWEPTQKQIEDYRYLAGIIDGEGACSHGSIAIGQSKYSNPDVYDGIEAVLNRLHIPYHIATVNPNESHILRNKTIVRGLAQTFVLGGGKQIKADILRFGRPAKAGRILNTIWKRAANPVNVRDKVLSIEPDGVETVYAIGTTSGNYTAYGFITKNTQYLNRPRAGEDVTFNMGYVHRHDNVDVFPVGLKLITLIDLASWGDAKRICRNVVLTGGRDAKNHLWIYRVDSGRFNPTEVIELAKSHVRQFGTSVWVEEVGYQIALRHFARLDMESADGFAYNICAIPRDGRKGAKELRINGLEPVVRNGMFHVLYGMTALMEEMEDYPYAQTKDILDCCGYLQMHARRPDGPASEVIRDPFMIESIEAEIKAKRGAGTGGLFEPVLWDDDEYASQFN